MDPGEVVDYHVNICTSHSENVCKQGAGRLIALLVNHGLKLVVLQQWCVITLHQKRACIRW